jgi:hypothetical protein
MREPWPVAATSAEPHTPPQVSADGNFYWDSERWVPMPQAVPVAPTKPVPNHTAAGLVIVGAAMAVIGCFLPWLSATAPFIGTVTRDAISSPDGEVIAAVATVCALIGIVMWARRVGFVVPIVLLIAAAIAMWTVVADYQDINSRVQAVNSTSIVAEVGVGVYLTGLGVIIWAIGAVAGFRQHR